MGSDLLSAGGYISDVAKFIDPVQEEYLYSQYREGTDAAERQMLVDVLSGMCWEEAERKWQAATNASFSRLMAGKRRLWDEAEDKLRAERTGSDNPVQVGCTATKVAA